MPKAVGISALLTLALASASADERVLLADFAGVFKCEKQRPLEVELFATRFLSEHGFRVLNLGAVQRPHGVYLQPVHVIGLDGQNRMVTFISFETPVRTYFVRLNSKPPTHHAVEFEEELESSAAPSCHRTGSNRGANGIDALPMFEGEVRRIEGLFEQVRNLGDHA